MESAKGDDLEVLKQFDLDYKYGPCFGVISNTNVDFVSLIDK